MVVLKSGKRAQSSLDKAVLKSEKRQLECSSSSDWASLPVGILDLILNRLVQLSDYLRFSAVCKPWFSAAAHHKDRRGREPHNQVVPFLLIPSSNQSPEMREAEDERRRLYTELQVPYPRRNCGSSHGWLANLEAEDLSITLLNPFSGKSLRFPRVNTGCSTSNSAWRHTTQYEFDVAKVVLSCNPCSSPNDVVLAIYGLTKLLAYIKPGLKHWTYVWGFNRFEDAIYHRGKFYVVDIGSRVLSLDVSKSNAQVMEVAPRTPTRLDKSYIVESSSGADLLLVQRFQKTKYSLKSKMTSSFKIFKLLGLGSSSDDRNRNNDQQIIKKVEITSLGDDTLFLGDNYSLCALASHFPGCQANCIYYTDDSFHVFASFFVLLSL